jgi:alpha-L-fucosidase
MKNNFLHSENNAILILSLVFFFTAIPVSIHAQQSVPETPYEWPQDSLVKQKLEKWRNQKFGMIIHWGLYAVPGIVESWSICNEDWISRDSTIKYENYKNWYWGLKKDFNPAKFNPEQWAHAAKDAGMKYLVFTTKHHDGFCMFDTKETDFKITNGPFAKNEKSNVSKYVFDAFRKEGLMIGAYFSKPDWHSENYWWPMYATHNRNNNYDIRKFPWRWENFKKYTYNQISELMHDYGSMDILWLDGGWVRPLETVNDEVKSWGAEIPAWSQNIDMPKIATMARKAQPGLLIVDRTVHGSNENYRTPEQNIPATKLDYPWESCITLGGAWGYVPNENFKTATVVIHKLVEIVAKGGSLLLGIGPKADGTLPTEVVARLEEIGRWLKINGTAIYNTRTAEHYSEQNIFFTKSKVDNTYFAIACLKENATIPSTVEWTINIPAKNSKMICLQTGKTVKWIAENNKVVVNIPEDLINAKEKISALAFSFKSVSH